MANRWTGRARAVWADGLCNPFTFAVQAVSGRIHINDVGQFVGRVVLAADNGNAACACATLAGNPVDWRVGADGALYVLTRNAVVRINAP